MKIFFLLWGCLASMLLVNCGGEKLAGGAGAGNPPSAKVAFVFKASSSPLLPLAKKSSVGLRNPDGTFSLKDSVGSLLTLSTIKIFSKSIELILPDSLSCDEIINLECIDRDVTLKGPYSMDLITGLATPNLRTVELPAGSYKGFKLQFLNEEDNLPSVSLDSVVTNVILKGKIATTGKAFAINLLVSEDLEFIPLNGTPIKSSLLNNITLSVSIDKWFDGIDMLKCFESKDVQIDSTGTLILQGDKACGGSGQRMRLNIEKAESEVDHQDVVETK